LVYHRRLSLGRQKLAKFSIADNSPTSERSRSLIQQ
jgi:hypothetical protein